MGLGIDEILINFLNYEYKIDFNNVQVINIHIYANLMPVFFLKCENRYFIMELDYIKNSISYIEEFYFKNDSECYNMDDDKVFKLLSNKRNHLGYYVLSYRKKYCEIRKIKEKNKKLIPVKDFKIKSEKNILKSEVLLTMVTLAKEGLL